MNTTVPVPAIIDADPSPYNEIHAPYLIMEYMEGRTLDRVWFGEDGDESKIRETRAKILRGLARIMLQLGRYEFETGGAPIFDEDGVIIGVGTVRELDVQAMVQRWFGDEDCEKAPLYAGVGPFHDAAEMYEALLDLYPSDDEANIGVDKLLRLLISFVREPSKTRPPSEEKKRANKKKEKGFVLTHPDFSLRNIIVSEEGHIEAILGWDGTRIAPKSIGNEALPRWLTRDFNPFVWRWRPAIELWRKGGEYEVPEENRFEDAPWVQRELRSEYANTLRRKKRRRRLDIDVGVDVTRQSLLALNLDTAARDPRCRTAILRRILEKCSRISEEFDFNHIVELLGSGKHLDMYKLQCLERNFRELVDHGYVRGGAAW
ncbi:uncharacterized protein F4822DRAFT_390273 [Hypoxylon trugodes]|uniref:uncharacterized protein n=1 Tax=Hypoxylon trugodes TaxID=326681 RepID=UPI0021A13255|nr:uncharacterized protein F4822DRAFT_390273 [Hypoxylon trugodes]KAI1392257.1 hypothetical protein F4822DRAFT_390273 [Hypoxylon trugodes]